jgi:hypothetical protein
MKISQLDGPRASAQISPQILMESASTGGSEVKQHLVDDDSRGQVSVRRTTKPPLQPKLERSRDGIGFFNAVIFCTRVTLPAASSTSRDTTSGTLGGSLFCVVYCVKPKSPLRAQNASAEIGHMMLSVMTFILADAMRTRRGATRVALGRRRRVNDEKKFEV